MGHKTALYEQHLAAGAKLVDFGGWDMPINYGSQIEEHHQVRRDAGVFDVSHMTVVDVTGSGARDYLRHLLANDVDKLTLKGKALYTAMLNPEGGVIDDLIVYRLGGGYRLVVNCATRQKDLDWLARIGADFDIQVTEQTELAMIAIQGPEALDKSRRALSQSRAAVIDSLKPFQGELVDDWLIATTGYTGEQGLEIILPQTDAPAFWEALLAAGVKPCGLGARDTLRLEAGMNLYGHEMDEQTSPLAANMGWSVAFEPAERDFIGRTALETERARGPKEKLVGLVLRQRGILRADQPVHLPGSEASGVITSGSFSPTLGFSIALARVPREVGTEATVLMRGKKEVAVEVVKPRFVRFGKSLLEQH